MRLMMSVSGVRGVIGETLTPVLATELGCAFGTYLDGGTVVIGRDSRPSGPMLEAAVVAGLLAAGCRPVLLGIASTPATAMMVRRHKAAGGIVITASHNPIIWNGIKFLTDEGLAPPPQKAEQLFAIHRERGFRLVDAEGVPAPQSDATAADQHVEASLSLADVKTVAARRFRVVLDSVNGAGGEEGRALLERLGCQVVHINGEPTGRFAHTPEPLAENLTQLCDAVRREKAVAGFAQDPDADRLAIVDQTGRYIGEEYTLALMAKLLFASRPGPAAANLSTSRMIDDLAAQAGGPCKVFRSAVGEANVVATMKANGCVFGGEGNGGVIDPRVGVVRDSLVAMAIVLQLMTETGKTLSALVSEIPAYTMIKTKFECSKERIAKVLVAVRERFARERVNDIDGTRVDWPDGWVHVRGSNTEPMIRIIAEAPTQARAEALVAEVRKIADGIA
ncbi:MAG TPA: phosphoglucosamine mutase [Phycisphaerae bacterium]|nr:phosphoglucosamine mutase [Phycisphaerae bacterium]HRY67098.1 phosphoglucosamine mutase [Phycisphaerae bacterium]HSA26533.1 phosphoglucosamine mutase [Phycisphaerae bacterium]